MNPHCTCRTSTVYRVLLLRYSEGGLDGLPLRVSNEHLLSGAFREHGAVWVSPPPILPLTDPPLLAMISAT